MLERAIYCVSDRRHLLGFVALLNSLRLAGHEEPVFLVDAGLDAEQRSLVEEHATVLEAPPGTPAVFMAPLGPTMRPSRVSLVLDADIVVLRPLTELVTAAESGRLVAFIDNEPDHDRFFPEWETMLSLGPLHRHPYINAGALVLPDDLGVTLFPRWIEGQQTVDLAHTRYGNARHSDPLYFADQDVLNAVVAATLRPAQLLAIENRLAPNPPFADLRLADRERMICRYADGAAPFLLHHFLAKPWLNATRISVYSSLLPRLLLAPDVTIRLEPEQLPRRLREGRLAALDRRRAHVQATITADLRRQLGRFGVRTRLAHRRRKAARASGKS